MVPDFKTRSVQINKDEYVLTLLHGEFEKCASEGYDFSFKIGHLPKNKKMDDAFITDYFSNTFEYRLSFYYGWLFLPETLDNINFLIKNFDKIKPNFNGQEIEEFLKSWRQHENEEEIFNLFVDRLKVSVFRDVLSGEIDNIPLATKPKRKM